MPHLEVLAWGPYIDFRGSMLVSMFFLSETYTVGCVCTPIKYIIYISKKLISAGQGKLGKA